MIDSYDSYSGDKDKDKEEQCHAMQCSKEIAVDDADDDTLMMQHNTT
jgi:hypothetical protein